MVQKRRTKQQSQDKELRFEWKRKALHVLVGLIIGLFLWFTAPQYWIPILVGILLVGVILSIIERHHRIPLLTHALNCDERKEDRVRYPGKGLVTYIAGVLLAALFFNQTVPVISGLIVLSIGNPIAHLVGRKTDWLQVPWNKKKSIFGRVVAVLVCWGVLHIFWTQYFIFPVFTWYTLLIGPALGMLVETLPLNKIGLDDNLLIPVVTGVGIYLVL